MERQEYALQAETIKQQLYRTALLYLGQETAALDAVDEAIYKGFCSCRKLREPAYFTTWLTRILINTCNNELRHRKRELPSDSLPESAASVYDALPLQEAIRRLPQELRAVIILRFFQDLTLAETAAVLALPRGTVSTRQKKALGLLKLELA